MSAGDLVKYLAGKGFDIRPGRGSHYVAKKGTLMAVIPADDELASGTLHAILAELGISREQFLEDWK